MEATHTTIRKPRRRPIRLRREKDFTFHNFAVGFFLVACIGLYYPQLIVLVWAGYALAAAALGLQLFNRGGIDRDRLPFLLLSMAFGFFSLVSILWAYSEQYCLDSTIRMLRNMMMGVALCLLIRTRRQFDIAMLWMAIAAVVFALMYLQFIDLTKLAAARMAATLKENVDGLPNYNVVAMYLAFGCTYFIYQIVCRKRLKPVEWVGFSLLLVASVAIILIFGSRKSILAVILSFLFFFAVQSSGKKKTQLVLLVAIGVCLVISFIPMQYLEYVMNRLLKLTDSSGALDRADQFRIILLEQGFKYIGESPLFGHGYYNFSELMGRDTGVYMYAHNNYVECLTDVGLIGTLIYFSIYWLIIKNCWQTRRQNPSFLLIAVMMAAILFNGFFIVYLGDSFIWCLLGLLYAGSRGFRGDHIEKAPQSRRVPRRQKRVIPTPVINSAE